MSRATQRLSPYFIITVDDLWNHIERLENQNENLRRQVMRRDRLYRNAMMDKEEAISLVREFSTIISESRGECPVCLDSPRSIACIPCGHLFCVECVKLGGDCPICRKSIDGTMRVYI